MTNFSLFVHNCCRIRLTSHKRSCIVFVNQVSALMPPQNFAKPSDAVGFCLPFRTKLILMIPAVFQRGGCVAAPLICYITQWIRAFAEPISVVRLA